MSDPDPLIVGAVSDGQMIRQVADQIRARRQEIDVSQEAAAHAADIHPTYWTRIEQGRINPPLATLWRVAAGFSTAPLPNSSTASEVGRQQNTGSARSSEV